MARCLSNTHDAFFCFLPPSSSNSIPPSSPSSIVSSSYSSSSSSSTRRSITHLVKLRRPSQLPLTKASNDERNPSGLIEEDSKFVPLNTDDPVYGPPALLLLGFEVAEVAKIQQLLKQLDGEFLQVILHNISLFFQLPSVMVD
uniref:Uncharacterized protein n=1 Tax=Rhizophora mucronata TaxID=61149 RepID=A0A2P2KIT8_RHIMU